MRIFVSQPMDGKTKEEIEKTYREAATNIRLRFKDKGVLNQETMQYEDVKVEILSTRNYIPPKNLLAGRHERLTYLSHAIQVMGMADAIYLCPGWESAKGCVAEANIAKMYGLLLIGEGM